MGASPAHTPELVKAPSGVAGLDEITGGGLPRSRTTLVCGAAGCGKTLLGVQFLVTGALEYNEPGVLVAFEESAADLSANVASLGWDLDDLVHRKLLVIDEIRIQPHEIIESGAWDLDALILRIEAAIQAVGAKRVVLDTVETLFAALHDEAILRIELRRLFRWLGERGVTAIVTGEHGVHTLTRHGLEEYMSDCVITLDQRLVDRAATRRLRILKYRGSAHGNDEYPFIIDQGGFSVLPVTSLRLEHTVSHERVSLGVDALDAMVSGGPFRGTTVLVTGNPGAGKTTMAAGFLAAGCARGERGILFAYEESPDQIVRNMASVGLDLGKWRDAGLLRIVAARPSAYGLERHLTGLYRHIVEFGPQSVALDPATALRGERFEIASMLTRLVDHLKCEGITALLTAMPDDPSSDNAALGVSSMVDTWIQLSNVERLGERNRAIAVVKSRGMAHSPHLREFHLTSEGIDVRAPYAEGDEVLMGTARQAREAADERAREARAAERRRTQRGVLRRQQELQTRIALLQAELEAEAADAADAADIARAAERGRLADSAGIVAARAAGWTADRTNGRTR